jgi:hypothetical protein
VVREYEQQLVIDTDGFVNLFVDFPSALDVFWSVPTSYTFALESVMEALSECLVSVRVTDKN